MKHRKSFPGIFDDRQLETLGIALDLVLGIAHPSTRTAGETNDDYAMRVARQMLELAHGMDYDADYLAQLTLERLIASQDRPERAAPRHVRDVPVPRQPMNSHRNHERR